LKVSDDDDVFADIEGQVVQGHEASCLAAAVGPALHLS
jgi:hypothetical protein